MGAFHLAKPGRQEMPGAERFLSSTEVASTAIILAGGLGTRVSAKADEPKAMIDIAGTPAIVRIIATIVAAGIDEIYVVTSEAGSDPISRLIGRAFGDLISLHIVVQPVPHGPGHALMLGLGAAEERAAQVLVVLCDTLFSALPRIGDDWVGVARMPASAAWCWVRRSGTDVTGFYDKVIPPADADAVLVGVYHISHPAALREILECRSPDQSPTGEVEISQGLAEYSLRYPMRAFQIDTWLDCGTAASADAARRRLIRHRAFNRLDWGSGQWVTKCGPPDEIDREARWLAAAQDFAGKLVPAVRNIDHGKYQIEKISLPLLASGFLYYWNSEEFLRVFARLIGEIDAALWSKPIPGRERPAVGELFHEMYVTKTELRLAGWARWERFCETGVVVNDTEIADPRSLVRNMLMSAAAPARAELSIMHGDLHFGNIFASLDSADIKLIDPRGSFGSAVGIAGDKYYDLAKLRHSYHGLYDAIVHDLFQVSADGNRIELRLGFGDDDVRRECDAILAGAGFDLTRVRLAESAVMLSLIPLHREAPSRQLAFFARAVLNAAEIAAS